MSISARRLQRVASPVSTLTSYRFGFEAGTNGAAVASGVAASGDTAWAAVGIGVGSTLTYDTDQKAHGTMSAKLIPAASSTAVTRWTIAATHMGAFRYYVRWDAYPTADTIAVWLGSDSSTKVASINFSTAGNIRAYGTQVSSAYSTPSATLPLGSWARVELAYQIDSVTSTNGKLRLAVYAGDSTTALADSGWVTTDLGTAGVTYVRVGKYSSDANTSMHWLDSITLTAGATGLLGPAGTPANQLPIANAGMDQSVATAATVTLDGAGSYDPDGSIASYTWAQTSGSAVTLSSTSAQQPTFTAPATAETLTFSLVVTDNSGAASTADTVTVVVGAAVLAYDWSETNLPWAYSSESQFTTNWEPGLTYVDLPTGSSDFATNIKNACDAASGPIVIRLGVGVYHLNSFWVPSGVQTFSFGIYHPRLQGLLGRGADKTIIQMDANSMTQAQLDALSQLTTSDICHMGMMLLQPTSPSTRGYIGGVTFRAADQQNITSVHSTVAAVGVVTPQPAPHEGLLVGPNRNATISYCRFQGASRALRSAPPFELGAIGTQYADVLIHNTEIDCRRAPEIDPAQPRRGTPILGNNEDDHRLVDCWLHHANVSRYAVNDMNQDTSSIYSLTRTKVEQIGNHNIDPALNGGVTLGGYSQAVCCGYESTRATITFNQPIISVDNPYTDGSVQQHIGLNIVGGVNRQGGRLYVNGGIFRNTAFPSLDGFLCIRISQTSYWYTDGWDNTIFVYNDLGVRKSAWLYTGSWPPTPAQIAAAGVSPETHYLLRNTVT